MVCVSVSPGVLFATEESITPLRYSVSPTQTPSEMGKSEFGSGTRVTVLWAIAPTASRRSRQNSHKDPLTQQGCLHSPRALPAG